MVYCNFFCFVANIFGLFTNIFRQHSNQECSDSKKSVTVQVGEKVKVPGQSSKKRIPSANLDLPRHGALNILTRFLL